MTKKNTYFILIITTIMILCACSAQGVSSYSDKNSNNIEDDDSSDINYSDMKIVATEENKYATQFKIDYYEDDYVLLTIHDQNKYLVVPEGKNVPSGIDKEITVIKGNSKNVYMVSTSSMDFVASLNKIDNIRLSSIKENDWYIDEAKMAMANKKIVYAGKYNAPDYELILSSSCNLAIANTMMYHNPETIEKLKEIGVSTFVDYSSYESHPLGRVEWIKVYGIIFGDMENAKTIFDNKCDIVNNMDNKENTEKKVVFFYINSNGAVNIRKSNDYVAKMIELAGGEYAFKGYGDEAALSTMNIQMEEFYSVAKDADILIYNSTIEGEINNIKDLTDKYPILEDIVAVKNKNVWCNGKNMYQKSTDIAEMIVDFGKIIHCSDKEFNSIKLNYLRYIGD